MTTMQIDKLEDVKKACSDLHNVQLASEFLSCNLNTVCSLEGALGIKGGAEETAQERLTNLIQGLEKLVEQAGKRVEDMSLLELEGLKSSLEKVLAVAVALRDGLQSHAPSEQKHALEELERCRALGWDGRWETDRLITATLTNPMAVSAAFLDMVLQKSVSNKNLALMANTCGSLLDKNLLQKLFMQASSSECRRGELGEVTDIIRAVGNIAEKKGITLEVKNCLGRAFTEKEHFTDSEVAMIGSVLQGLTPGHGTGFIKGILSHVADMQRAKAYRYADEWRDIVWGYTGEVFNGSTVLVEALLTLQKAGVKRIIDHDLAIRVCAADVGRGRITELDLALADNVDTRAFVDAAQKRARRAESPEAPPEEKPLIFWRGLFGIFGRLGIGGAVERTSTFNRHLM